VLLAIIGPNWLDARDEHGKRRLDDPKDFVRIEIAAALQRNIPVIPILLDGAPMPKAVGLPKDLKELTLRNGIEIRHASFQDDMNRLIHGLEGRVDQTGSSEDKQGIGLWGFLRDKRNQQVLGWLGGGLVIVATGLWAAFVYLFPTPPLKSLEATSSKPTSPSVQAGPGGIAIGGNVTGSNVTTNGPNLDTSAKPK
jgi:hypothetical protein